ncbi:MAG: carotenoid 1,2-hydratase [Puniceicoccaceae bacterium]|nr:MAG: carotenoid 1,2-hydratase [Puniceicoccaceae bacterium]
MIVRRLIGLLGWLVFTSWGTAAAGGFAVPEPGRELPHPQRHGSHPDFRIEWWYVTGHLEDEAGARFGFQATFFRRAAAPPGLGGDGADGFGRSQLFLAHMAWLEVETGRFHHQERLNRDGWDAHARVGRLDVANGNWRLRMVDETEEAMELVGGVRDVVSFRLRLVPRKPLVRFGRDGVSRKSADLSAASYYLSFTRLEVSGEMIQEDGAARPVRGQAWMDHEISSSQLDEGQVGWDWVSMQLEDGREVMAYRLRREEGTDDPFSTLAWVDREGRVEQVKADGFRWMPLREWRSPKTGGRYPVQFALEGKDPETGLSRRLEFRPLADAQELTGGAGGIDYWEGAGDVLDEDGRVIGRGFAELTGYTGSIAGRF